MKAFKVLSVRHGYAFGASELLFSLSGLLFAIISPSELSLLSWEANVAIDTVPHDVVSQKLSRWQEPLCQSRKLSLLAQTGQNQVDMAHQIHAHNTGPGPEAFSSVECPAGKSTQLRRCAG